MNEIKINFSAFEETNQKQIFTEEVMKQKLIEHRQLFSSLSATWEGKSGEAFAAAAENALKYFYLSIETLAKLKDNTVLSQSLFELEDLKLSEADLKGGTGL